MGSEHKIIYYINNEHAIICGSSGLLNAHYNEYLGLIFMKMYLKW